MLPLAHTYIATKVTGRKDDLLLFGSVLPDITLTSSRRINEDMMHKSPQQFYGFIKKSYPEFLDLALGIMLHSEESKGADIYTDDQGRGFAYKKGRHLSNDVAALLKMEPGEVSLQLSHNFIEGALDLLLAINHPDIITTYRDVQRNVAPSLISKSLADYLGLTQQDVEKELEFFKDFLSYKHLSTKEGMVDGIGKPLIKMLMNIDVDRAEAVKLFGKAVTLIEEGCLQFLDDTVNKMKVTFAPYL